MPNHILKAGVITCILALASVAVTTAQAAEEWPNRSVRMLVGSAPGGGTDIMARIVADGLGPILKQPVVVENRPGVSNTLAANVTAKSNDGVTMVMGVVTAHAIAPHLLDLPYNSNADLTPVAYVGTVPNVLVVSNVLPAKSVADLVGLAKASDNTLNYASSGIGSTQHIAAEMFEDAADIELTHVPYRGSSAAQIDLISGQVQLSFDTLPSVLPQIQSNKMRALAVTTAARNEQLPDVPTMTEAGYPQVDINAWYGLYMPSDTPPAVVQKVHAAVNQILTQPSAQARLLAIGAIAEPMSQAEFAQLHDADTSATATSSPKTTSAFNECLDMTLPTSLPTIALTLGDPAGIGAELIARLLANPEATQHANLVLIGDAWLWEKGQNIAGVQVPTDSISDLSMLRSRHSNARAAFLAVDTIAPDQVEMGVAGAAGGKAVLQVLNLCMDAALAGDIDAICFAPLNKQAMKMGGLQHEDELHHFAQYLGVKGYFCEFNTLGDLWTSRISSHIPLKEVTKYITQERITQAAELIYEALRSAGVKAPKIAIAGLNPHNGDGGTCGREEIEIIAPAVQALQARSWPTEAPFHGPYPADTIFLRAQAGQFQAVVTMYHDQGQIAIKLLGFSKGVTVQGGMPIPITTPAHGTAYDIAGLGRANVQATWQALLVAARMGTAYRAARTTQTAHQLRACA